MERVHSAKIAFAMVCLLALAGCAAAALSVVGLVGSTGLDHTLNGIVDRTYAAPLAGTRLAALQSLKRLGMEVEKSEKQATGWTIKAKAANRGIAIDLEPLSDLTTQAQVVVSNSDFIFLKDSSTGIEILDQISDDLSKITPERHRFATAQMLLTGLGYDPGLVDGRMGSKTRGAIVRFQRKNAIRPDGDVSPRLIALLRKQTAARDEAAKNKKQAKLEKQGESPTR